MTAICDRCGDFFEWYPGAWARMADASPSPHVCLTCLSKERAAEFLAQRNKENHDHSTSGTSGARRLGD